jgi:RHS repeat-associated protein
VFPPADDAGRTVYNQTTYDNLDRAVKQERYLEISGSADRLLARSETSYDDRGRVYQTKRYAVDVSDGSVGNSLVSNTWYDAAGNAIKQQPAGSQAFTKTVYDSLGRAVKQYLGYDTDETAYADASSVSDDTIVEQSETTFDDASNEIGRQIAVANYGTYDGAIFSRAAVVPNRTDTILVTSTEYNDAGQAYKTIDPAGREDRQVFDDAGRVTKTIQNYIDGVVNGSYPDEDVTVEMAYNADGNLEALTAKNATTGDQVTTYVYGTTLTESEIATSTLKRAEIYPDSDDTPSLGDGTDGVFDRIEFCYNWQSQQTSKKDQNGSIHVYEYDALGRMLHDRVTTVGSGVDETVLRISTTYNLRGQVETLSSYDNATVGSGNVVNQVVFEYDEHGLLVEEYQEHDGAKDANTPYVGYDYDTSASSGVFTKGLRLTSLRYPNGRLVHYTYGSSGSSADALGRIAAINDDDSGSPGDALAEYGYLGAASIIQVDYPEPDIRFDLAHGAGDDPYDGPMDHFGRVTDLLWRDYGGSADVVRIQHGYDREGNRLWREDPVAASYSKDFDELYTYDGMYQLVDMQRGDLNATKDGLVANSKTFAEDWSLDMTGNWSTYRQDEDGDGNWDLNQLRTHNGANEITQIAGVSTHVAHDRNGNMTKTPKPDDWSNHFDLTYDAWNRLVAVEDGEVLVAEYGYDARNFRVVKKRYDGGELDETRQCFFTSGWQCIEQRREASLDAQRQFVWGLRHSNDLILRDRDADTDSQTGSLGTTSSGLEERVYSLQDPNTNVVVLADANAAILERYGYDAYGGCIVLDSSFGNRVSSACDWSSCFAGYELDSELGTYCVRHRCLNSALGVWCSRDPLGERGGDVNVRRYASSRPHSLIDVLGLAAFQYEPGRGTFTTLVFFRTSSKGMRSIFSTYWTADPATFQGSNADGSTCKRCDLIGFAQIARQTAHFSGGLAWYWEFFFNEPWKVDAWIPYPDPASNSGYPAAADPTVAPFAISMEDMPGIETKGLLGGRVDKFTQEFETCVVCVRGLEGIRFKESQLGQEPYTRRLRSLTVYGCVKWMHSMTRRDDGSYIERRRVEDHWGQPNPYVRGDSHTVAFPRFFAGVKQSETFERVVQADFERLVVMGP